MVLHLCCPSDIEFIMRTDNEYPWDYYRSSDHDREAVFRMGKLAVHLGSNLREFKLKSKFGAASSEPQLL